MRLGDDKQMQVEGKGIVAINDGHGDVKLLYNLITHSKVWWVEIGSS